MEATMEKVKPAGLKTLLERINNIGTILEENVDEEEGQRSLSDPVSKALRENGLLRLFMPESLGGLEADPLTVAILVEEASKYNAAAGWTMMVANVSTWWCGRLSQKGVEEIYQDGPDTLMAGAVHPPMAAIPAEGGFLISGRVPLTSHVHAAKWVFVSACVMANGQMKMNNGRPEIIGVFMEAEKCEIVDTWYTIGMKATDSNDVAASEVFVPYDRSFPLMPEYKPNKYYDQSLYRFPAVGISANCLIAPVALAIASNAIREVKTLAGKKTSFGSVTPLRERGVVQRKLGQAEALVQSGRAYMHETIRFCWNKIKNGETVTMEEKAGLLLSATHANQSALQAVDLMYSAAGSHAIYTRNKLSRYFTDAQVVRQHGFTNDSRYETAAQVFLGLQPDLPILAF
jgi:indole-3-acetate monooxygenase